VVVRTLLVTERSLYFFVCVLCLFERRYVCVRACWWQGKGEMETFFLNGRRGRPLSSAGERQTPILNGLRVSAQQLQQS